jgi:hypothetical protein
LVALTPIGPHTDLENLVVSNDPECRALIERSRRLHSAAGTGLTTAQLRRRLCRGRRTGR